MEIQEAPATIPTTTKVDFLTKIIQNEKGNALFREASTILEVINDTLQKDMQITPDSPGYITGLFAALFRNLQVCVAKDTYDHITAYILLFQYALQKVNPQVRQRSAEPIERCLDAVIANVHKTKVEKKYIITMYYSLLQVKTAAEWKKESTIKMFNYILEALDNEKMAMRKKASKCLSLLVDHGLFKIPEMDFYLQNYFLEYIKSSHMNPRSATYILYFLNNSLKNFPVRVAGEICHHLVAALKVEGVNIDLSTHIYSTIENLLASRPLSAGLVEGILKELQDNPPHIVEDSNINFAYIQCLTQTILHLQTVDALIAKGYISSCISACSEYLILGNSKLAALACKSIELIITHTVNRSLWLFSSNANDEESLESFLGIDTLDIGNGEEAKGPSPFQKVVAALQYLLNPQFDGVQRHVSSVLTTFFDNLDNTCPEPAYQLMLNWIESRNEKPQNVWLPVIGKFIQKVNLEFILKTYPLRILETNLASVNYENESNSWLLPVLRKYLRIDSIKLFLDYFLPIVAALDEYIYSKPAEEFTEVERTLELIYIQLWEIFPKFCKFTKENVPFIEQIYEITTRILANRFNVRKHVCQGLEILCSYLLKLPKFTNPQMIQAQQILVACSNKLMPKLCAMYMKDAASAKSVIKLIRTLAGLCSKDFLETVFLKHIKKLVQEKLNNKPYTVSHLKECDILIAMASSMDLAVHYDIVKQFVKSFLPERSGFQKRAFRLLQVLAVKVHSSFLPDLFEMLEEANLVQSSSKLGKLSCILTILGKMEYTAEKMEEIVQAVQKLLPEVLVALKETNRKTRKVAVNIVKFLTQKFMEFEAVPLFASLVTAGLAGNSSLMKSVSILGLAQVIKEAKSGVDENFIWETTSIVLLMVKEKNREIYKAVLQYLKAYIKVVPKSEVQKNLQNILLPIFEWDEDGRDEAKLTLRHITEKLVRKLGRSVVEANIPSEHKKLVRYITKQEKISKKKKEEKRNERRRYLEDMAQEKVMKAEKAENDFDEDEREEPVVTEMIDDMQHDTNNLLLKFDTMKERFHFVEHPIAKIKERKKKEEEMAKSDRDVYFNEQTGKIYVNDDDNTITGKKRRGDTRFDEAMIVEEEAAHPQEQPRTVRKVVRLTHERAMAKVPNAEEQKGHSMEEPKKRSLYNKKIISDIKIFNSDTLNPTAYIPINPKILNKRNRASAPKAFEFLMTKKKTGSLAGLKSKVKN